MIRLQINRQNPHEYTQTYVQAHIQTVFESSHLEWIVVNKRRKKNEYFSNWEKLTNTGFGH